MGRRSFSGRRDCLASRSLSATSGERKHRRAPERSDQAMRQSIALDHKAKRLESRAASVGQGGIDRQR